MPGVEPVEVPPDPTVFAGSWFNSAAIIKCELNFFFFPLGGRFTCSAGSGHVLERAGPFPSGAKCKPKPFCCPGGVSQGLPIPSAVLGKVSCFICSSEEAQSEGLGSSWGSVCFPLTINARFPIVGGVRGFAGQLGGGFRAMVGAPFPLTGEH